MAIYAKLKKLIEIFRCFFKNPLYSLEVLGQLPNIVQYKDVTGMRYLESSEYFFRANDYLTNWKNYSITKSKLNSNPEFNNTLRDFYENRKVGRGIWKWLHYFDIYDKHFSKFVDKEVNILEIGVYSGGSLEMWRNYFGEKCNIYGIDIKEECLSYENNYTKIFIGDQQDRNFWKLFRQKVPSIDIIIDDGGHQFEQQIVTLEELLPYLNSGGIYLCEDIEGKFNRFNSYTRALVSNLNNFDGKTSLEGIKPTEFQKWFKSITYYPFVIVIEKADFPVDKLICKKRGTQWQPFYEKK